MNAGNGRAALVGGVTLVVALVGCAHAPRGADGSEERTSAFYPLAVGNRWVYRDTFLGNQRSQEVEIVKLEDGYYVDSTGAHLIADAFGVRDDKRYLLREPLEQDRAWTNVVSVSSIETYRILAVGQGCHGPAGTFEGCVVVESRNRQDEQTTLVNELTFAPHVGLVEIQMHAEHLGKSIPQRHLVLERFAVQSSKRKAEGPTR